MVSIAIGIDYSSGLPLIIAAGIALYVATKALGDALVAGRAGMPGRLAFGQWVPIAMVAMVATITGRQSLAMGLIFSTAVACLSLATGAVGFFGVAVIAPAARRSWAMLVPAAMLSFLIGFHSSISLFNAGLLALQGICVLLLWIDRTDAKPDAAPIPLAGRGILFRLAQLLLGFVLAIEGGYFAMHGVDLAAAGTEFATSGLLAATLIGPLLVLPIIGTGTELAQRNQSATAIGSHVGVALLNICLLLPMVVVTDVFRQMVLRVHENLHVQLLQPVHFSDLIQAIQKTFPMENIAGFPFPLAVWRVDVILLIAVSLFLLPIALGKWSISKLQGLGLMLGYAFYLGLTVLWRSYILYGVPLKSHP
jgi:hypothetical protein